MAQLIIIWDYDTPISRITATKPYNYVFEKCLQEEKDIDFILEVAKNYNAQMTFAIVGFGAEKSVYPFDIRHKIVQISEAGHEIASHSWKHEWFPFLTKYQIENSLRRSEESLEAIVGKDKVKGFVPPHDRPYSWIRKCAFSLGDRALYPFHPGADIGYIGSELKRQNYSWYRVSYRNFLKKIMNWKGENFSDRLKIKWKRDDSMVYFQSTYNGFDTTAQDLLKEAVKLNTVVVIVGHPAAISWDGKESKSNFQKFMGLADSYVKEGKLEFLNVSNYIKKYEI